MLRLHPELGFRLASSQSLTKGSCYTLSGTPLPKESGCCILLNIGFVGCGLGWVGTGLLSMQVWADLHIATKAISNATTLLFG